MKPDLFDLTGKRAIVTGAAQGLGRSMAEGLLEYGAEAVLFDVSASITSVAHEFRDRGFKCQSICVDLSDRGQLKNAFQEACALLGERVDILINAAGIQRRHPPEEFPIEDWDAVISVNLTAVFILCQLAGKKMLIQGSGKIINIASINSIVAGKNIPAYAASKAGIQQLTRSLANHWASKGINVNAIAPGYFDTPMNANINCENNPKRFNELLERIPAMRWGHPDDIKGTVVYLASRASDYVNGVLLPVDGGFLGL
ncbi:MAG: SDR family oxidoreductase [Spirochaetales bacterium]|jgi:2-deoxy-D-gluconate 3-dehydrogenase